MFAIKAQEKENTSKYVNTLINNLMISSDGIDALKIIVNYVAKTSSNQSELKNINEEIFENKNLIKSYLNKTIDYMIEAAVEEEINYTTGELSKYFGVSITAINKWIDQGRFIGVERLEKNKQVRISQNTLWKSRKGNTIPVKQIVETYIEETFSDKERISAMKESIKFFENKYGGSFESVSKNKKDISPEDEANFREWGYLLSEIN
ncbi:helix-turn-helix domain-containing protein [Clostridium botulinum]|uniref:helix-turn-helix domain-containing protein n=1 Tax=Clostridium botulinum TaxID=1491 RepID=UPI00077441C7|nr:helix-turn-helix domain-containing protein [Clostridium botulinum]NFE96252.1 helix-turn-helix domain-containing protein [Clostridium botulinum]NFL39782.1 helix-turn-helix domain-containing protein [Clostridium botulinum]NFL66650.1 helix-turn-helix domain-containing protein [Clostridium botulinum]NFN09650.1 helix-turn-helix domain-containing protein [Clostridium botulinum]NFN26235.1 helix-turn-helix domain-containing protein [Clostridium botulinum]